MPLKNLIDDKGCYYQWGNQKKYYYDPNNYKSELLAKKKAIKQYIAIFYSKIK